MTFLSYAQNYEDVLLWRALKDVDAGFYIDVGAWDPDADTVTRAFSERGWHGINIEPVPTYHARLLQRRPRDINLAVALGAAAGRATLFDLADTGLSTLDPALAEKHAARDFAVSPRQVEVLTLAEVCRRHAPPAIHFLKIDCEGSERDVLLGADFARFRPWIVLVEATLPNSQEPSHGAWEDILLRADYRFAWFDGLNRWYVAAEHHGKLTPLLALPPNVFDSFVHVPRTQPAARDAARPVVVPGSVPGFAPSPVPVSLPVEDRIALAARCRDCDDLPKVADAGQVRTEADGTRVQVMHNGLKVLADGYCGSWMTRLITLCQGHHEPQEERLFHAIVAVLPPDATMLELGGNWAYYSAWFLQGAPGRRAVVLEPDPANRAVGERTMQLNGLRADFLTGFAGAEPAPPTLFGTERSGDLLLPRLSVPQILDRYGIETLDVLHCDTQGAELDVLTGSRALLQAGRVRWAVVSTHAHHISNDPLTHWRCLQLLRGCGAVIEAEHNPHESFSGDGLIVARFGAAPPGWRPVAISLARQNQALFREPVHDLAEVWHSLRDREALLRQAISAVFDTLLFRSADGPGLDAWADILRPTGDIALLLRGALGSDEFATKRRQFAEAYLGGDAAVPAVALPSADGPFGCTGLRLVLRRDGPLGRVGEGLLVPNDAVILPAVLQSGGWNAQHLDFLAERLDPARRYVLLDIGANCGLFTRQVLRAFPNIAECRCVEPDPGNYQALCFNLAGTQDASVHTHNIGLGKADGRMTFFRDAENCGNYSLHPDAMRDRPHTETTVVVRAAGPWLEQHAAGDAPILWKSDTQGNDETVVAATPWPVWKRVEVAMVELWRIRRTGTTPSGSPDPRFLERVADMPNRRLGDRTVSVAEIAAYAAGDDWAHEDLFLWR